MLYNRLKSSHISFAFPPFFFYGTQKYFGWASMALRRASFENGRRVLCIIGDGRHGPATISLSVSDWPFLFVQLEPPTFAAAY